MRKIWMTGAIFLTLVAQGWCDRLYVKNQLFKGYAQNVSKQLDKIQIDLVDLCKAAEFEIIEVEGNRFLVLPGQEPVTDGITGKKQLFFEGKRIEVVFQDHRDTVNLQEFVQAVGARLSYNSVLSAVELNFGSPAKYSRPAKRP